MRRQAARRRARRTRRGAGAVAPLLGETLEAWIPPLSEGQDTVSVPCPWTTRGNNRTYQKTPQVGLEDMSATDASLMVRDERRDRRRRARRWLARGRRGAP